VQISTFPVESVVTNYLRSRYERGINKKYMQKLTFAFYDPRLKVADFFLVEVNRADVLKEIEELMIIERETLKEIDSIVNSLLTF